MKRRWRGAALFAGSTVGTGLLIWSASGQPMNAVELILTVIGVLAMGQGKLMMSQYAFGESDE